MFLFNTLVGLWMNCYVDFRLGYQSALGLWFFCICSGIYLLWLKTCLILLVTILGCCSAISSLLHLLFKLLCFSIFLVFYKIEWQFPQRVPFCALLHTIDFQFRMDEKKTRSSKSNKHNLF